MRDDEGKRGRDRSAAGAAAALAAALVCIWAGVLFVQLAPMVPSAAPASSAAVSAVS